MELTEIYRQNDKQFIAILQNIRIGRCLPSLTKLLQSTSRQEIERDGIRATRLFTHKEDVAATNRRELEALEGEVRRFTAQDSDPHMSGTMDNLCPVSRIIELKIGAQVGSIFIDIHYAIKHPSSPFHHHSKLEMVSGLLSSY